MLLRPGAFRRRLLLLLLLLRSRGMVCAWLDREMVGWLG